MRPWLAAGLSLGALVALAQLPHPVIWTLCGLGVAVFWYLLLTAHPRRRRWEDVKGDHRRDSPRSSR